jgi:hypothetical protein
MLSEWNLTEVKLSVDRMGPNGELETMAVSSVTFEYKSPEADFLLAPPQVSLQFDRIDGRLFFYAHQDDQYRVDAEVRVSLDEARRIAERDLLQWHVPAAWRTVKSWREGHCMDVEERRESFLKWLPVPERAPAYPAFRFDLSSPEPSFIVVRATDGKVIARGLTGGGFGD